MANESPKQIVDKVESALADSQACPYCGLYDGTHTANCVYLLHEGDVNANRESTKRDSASNKTVKVAEDKADEPAKEEPIKETKTESVDEKELLEKMKPKK